MSTPIYLLRGCAGESVGFWSCSSLRLKRNETLVKLVCKTAPKSLFWTVKNAIVDLSIKMKGNSSGNSLSPGVRNKDFGAASQTLLTVTNRLPLPSSLLG